MYRNLMVLGMCCVGCKLLACDRWPPHNYNECDQARKERMLMEFGENRVGSDEEFDQLSSTRKIFLEEENYPDLLEYFYRKNAGPFVQ